MRSVLEQISASELALVAEDRLGRAPRRAALERGATAEADSWLVHADLLEPPALLCLVDGEGGFDAAAQAAQRALSAAASSLRLVVVDLDDAGLGPHVNQAFGAGAERWTRARLVEELHRRDTDGALLAWRLEPGPMEARLGELTPLRAMLLADWVAERYTQLSAAGGDQRYKSTLYNIFVDLPLEDRSGPADEGGFAALAVRLAARPHLLRPGEAFGGGQRLLLVGGPGQGKTTLGAYLCQLFRAQLLLRLGLQGLDPLRARLGQRNKRTLTQELRRVPRGLDGLLVGRVPVRVVLHQLAEALGRGEVQSLYDWIARRATLRLRDAGPVVTAEQVRTWLVQWPSLIVLDGLDEVPVEGRRGAVLRCLEALWRDLQEADAVVLVTSRPQGLVEEFPEPRWENLRLARLPFEVALQYTQTLLREWIPEDGARRDDLQRRVEQALREPGVAELGRTPLQLTILTLLLERQGAVARDAWGLYRDYYQVILDRERNRGIEAFEVLRGQAPLVERLHAEVAWRLHLRGESGEGGVGLDLEEFGELTRHLLQQRVGEGVEHEKLVASLKQAVLDRLVFLVPADGARQAVAFEIRSLQEFFAAQRLFYGPEEHIEPRLRALAASRAWRRVLQFAVGRIGVDREHLAPVVPGLCEHLDALEDGLGGQIGLGVDLAASILEGAGPTLVPTVRRALLDRLLGCEVPWRLWGVGHVLAKVALDEVVGWLRKWEGDSRHLWCIGGVVWALDEEFVVPDEFELTHEFWETEPVRRSGLEDYIAAWAGSVHFGEFFLYRLGYNFASDGVRGPPTIRLGGVGLFGYDYVSFGEGVSQNDLDTSLVADPLVRAVLQFTQCPDQHGLALALETLGTAKDRTIDDWIWSGCPWPLALVLENLSSWQVDWPQRARDGQFGDPLTWRAAEERWQREGLVLEDLAFDAHGDVWATVRNAVRPVCLNLEFLASPEEDAPEAVTQPGQPVVRLPDWFVGHVHSRLLGHASRAEPSWWGWQYVGQLGPDALEVLLSSWFQADLHPEWRPVVRSQCRELATGHKVTNIAYPLSPDSPHWMGTYWPNLPQHPELVVAFALVLPAAKTPPDDLSPLDAVESDPVLRPYALMIRAASCTDADAALLAARVQACSPNHAQISLLADIVLRCRPPGAFPLLAALFPSNPDALGQPLLNLITERLTPLHNPLVAERLDLPPARPRQDPMTQPPDPTPLSLRTLTLRDVRGWEHLELRPQHPAGGGQWLFLVGENGAGKSTLLRSLALALVPEGTAQGQIAEFNKRYGPLMRLEQPAASVTVQLSEGGPHSVEVTTGGLRSTGASPDLFIVGYGPRRGTILGQTQSEVRFSPGEEVETLFREGGDLVHGPSWLKGLERSGLRGDLPRELFDTVCGFICRLLPGVDQIEMDEEQVWLRGTAVGGRVPMEAVSDGYLTTAGWVIDLLARWLHRERSRSGRGPLRLASNFNEHMTGLVLIDEVDLHLHPRWQWTLVEQTRALFPNLTFIVTTHNPVTLLGARSGEVWVLERGSEGLRADRVEWGEATDAVQLLTGRAFGMPSLVDRDTLRLLDEHRALLRDAPQSPALVGLEQELERRLGVGRPTTLERIAGQAVADALREPAGQIAPDAREQARLRAVEAVRAELRRRREGGV